MTSNGFTRLVFYSNFFYIICLLALLSQTCIVLELPPAPTWLYLCLCCSTLLFYNHAYLSDKNTGDGSDERIRWYQENKIMISSGQILLTLVFLTGSWLLKDALLSRIQQRPLLAYWPLWLFPLLALLYFGGIQPGKSPLNLRQFGWLKPIIIALVWSGTTLLLPAWWHAQTLHIFYPNPPTLILFAQQTIFLFAISILFDIKDFESDHNQQLKTWAIRIGPEQLLKKLILPIAILGCLLELLPGYWTVYPPMAGVLNCIPWVLLIFACQSLHRKTAVLHYLWMIDGLIPVKASIGIIAHLLTT
ncbi:MAG: hypothetical protein ACK46Z_04880 [Bacteroidota bacterium]